MAAHPTPVCLEGRGDESHNIEVSGPERQRGTTRSSTKAASEGASNGPEKPKPSKTRAKRSKPTKADAGPPEKLPPESEDDQDSSATVGVNNSMAGMGGEAAGVVAATIAASATTTPADSATSAVTPVKSATSAVTPTDTAVTPTDAAVTPTDAATSATDAAATTVTPSDSATTAKPSPRLTAVTPPHSATTAGSSPLSTRPGRASGPSRTRTRSSSSPSANVPSLPLIAVLPPDPSTRRRARGRHRRNPSAAIVRSAALLGLAILGGIWCQAVRGFPFRKRGTTRTRTATTTRRTTTTEDNDDAEDDDDAQDDDDAEDDNRRWGSGGPDVPRLEAMRASLSAADSLTIKKEALDGGEILERARALWDAAPGPLMMWRSGRGSTDLGKRLPWPRSGVGCRLDYRLSLRRRGLSTPPHSPTATAATPFLVPSEPSPATAATDAAPTKDPATAPPAAAAAVVASPQYPSLPPLPRALPPPATTAHVVASPTPSTTPPATAAAAASMSPPSTTPAVLPSPPIVLSREDVHAAIAAANAAAVEGSDCSESGRNLLKPPQSGAAGDSHHARNPAALVQPRGGKGKGKAGKSTAEQNSADLMQEVVEETSKRAALEDAVKVFAAECEMRAKEIAEDLELPVETVRMAFRGDSLLRKERAVNMDHARSWKLRQQIDADRETRRQNKTSLPGDTLPHDLHALRAQVKELVKNTPPTEEEDEALREEFDAAKDVTWTGDRMYDELARLERRTGARGIILIGSSHAQDSIQPMFLATPASRGFPQQSLKISGDLLAQMFDLWARIGMPTDLKKEVHTKKRSEVVQMIDTRLNGRALISGFPEAITGRPDVKMSYTSYHEHIVLRLGYRLVGWPAHIPMVAPSNMKAGASEDVRHLHRLLSSGRTLTTAAREELTRKAGKSSKRKAKATVQRLKASTGKKGGKRRKAESSERGNSGGNVRRRGGAPHSEEGGHSPSAVGWHLGKKTPTPTTRRRQEEASDTQKVGSVARTHRHEDEAPAKKKAAPRKKATEEPAPKKAGAKRPRAEEGDDQGPAKKVRFAGADLGTRTTAAMGLAAPPKKTSAPKPKVATAATALASGRAIVVEVPKRTRKKKVVSSANVESSGRRSHGSLGQHHQEGVRRPSPTARRPHGPGTQRCEREDGESSEEDTVEAPQARVPAGRGRSLEASPVAGPLFHAASSPSTHTMIRTASRTNLYFLLYTALMGVAAGVAEAPMRFFIKSTRPMAAVAAAFGGYF
ncbi:hypothetical protein C8J57DRAFT_1244078 [Mycena rebaudengoi]|nr:hypothetical protein C8J57DRAFT_1244078 [Mycena rebaudengoi]